MSLNYAHRGASGYYPENTMLAFQKAVEMGCEGIETDVQLTKDGVLVLCHDELVDRTTDGKGLISEINYKDIEKLDAAKLWGGRFKDVKIPTLEELLGYVKNKDIVVNLELKNSIIDYKNLEKLVIDMIDKYNLKEKVIISSFNHYSILRCKAIDCTLKLGLLYSCRIFQPGKYASELGVSAVHPLFYSLDETTVREIKEHKLAINTYTVNDEKYMRELIKLGIDGIITNYPDKLKKVLEEQR
ncbi:glycerophosphodiester phosphodiesterase [Clostridium swellfunianum]|uniref:glycerophosphodiester phosphodiesterase n=1 Tax=Clostridium swellfunianum TaxID=1367462 RepID=UPI0020304822|nr:glycerophosphodiester phosphodiesterase [Clostridium swellfunianum]MCM0650814.1 glycerophosphodiester phosphodiesterase [Clostridium swellfunianum]